MRDDQRFEIERAFDLLPHVIGASWATTWFRLNRIKSPSAEDFREKTVEYMALLEPLCTAFPDNDTFAEVSRYCMWRKDKEIERIRDGLNDEIEKRHKRYLDYG